MQRIPFWRLVFYVSWTVLGIWLILKVTGIINTPIWLEYGIPVASLIFGILGVYKDLLDNIRTLAVGLATLNTRFEFLAAKVDHIDKDVEALKDTARS